MGQYGSSNFNEAKIFSWLSFVYDTYMLRGYEVLGVFLKGSNNYALDSEKSDIDCLCIVVPSFKDLVQKNQIVSVTQGLDDSDNLVDLKDIRTVISCYLKQNVNFVESLFSDYHIVNPAYIDLWAKLWERREDIATYFPWRGLKVMQGDCMSKHKSIFKCNEGTSIYDEVKEYGYSSKNLHHLARIVYIMSEYIPLSKLRWDNHVGINEVMFGIPYKQILTTHPQWVVDYKQKGFFKNPEDVKEIADKLLAQADNIVKQYEEDIPNYAEQKNEEIYNLLKSVEYDIIYRKARKDVMEGNK